MIKKILDSAIICFSRNGFHKTTIDDIAANAGVSKGGVYYHYKNKSEIIYAVLEKGVKTMNACWVTEFEKDQPVTVMLKNMIDSFITFSFNFPELMKVTFGEATIGLDSLLIKKINVLQNTTIKLLAYQLDYGKKLNAVKKDVDSESLATGLIGMVASMCTQNDTRENRATKEQLVNTAFSIISSGIFEEDKTNMPTRIKFL